MSQLSEQLQQYLQQPDNQQLGQAILQSATIAVLQDRRLLGEILLQLPRQVVNHGDSGLKWADNQLMLQIRSKQIQTMDSATLPTWLEHEALHALWQHPVRYAQTSRPGMVKVATDVAVNQYLTTPPAGTVDLATLERLLKKKLPTNRDSSEYLKILMATTIPERERLKQAGIDLEQSGQQGTAPQESHVGWQSDHQQAQTQLLHLAHLRALTKRALARTPQRDRGLLPGDLLNRLTHPANDHHYDWRQVLKRQVGLVARGRQDSHARFNRRQPVRMELPGQVMRLVNQLLIFVDNSGSMTDQELAMVMNDLQTLSHHYDVPGHVYPFDAHVHEEARQDLGHGLFKRQRTGGGGTSYQPIFDFLRQQRFDPANNQIIIITDGYGEEAINQYQYRQVDWLLTTDQDELSVRNLLGRVLTMKEGRHE